MKKIHIIIAFILFSLLSAKFLLAQNITTKGIKLGLNISNLGSGFDKIDGINNKPKAGFAIGGYFLYSFNDNIGIRPEILYSIKGGKYEGMGEKLTFTLNYLEVPILLQYTIPTENSLKLNIFAGPAFGYYFKGSVKKNTINSVSNIKSKDIKTSDIMLVFGAGVSLNKSIIFSIQYNWGVNTYYNEEIDSSTKIDLRQQTILISINQLF